MKKIILLLFLSTVLMWSCDKDDDANYIKEIAKESTDPIDVYFRKNFLDAYGTAVRWKWEDRLVADEKQVAPPKREVCIPMGDLLKELWLGTFEISEPGKIFMKDHFPPELVFVGTPMYNTDGSITLGYADAGVRITFTEVNDYDLKNRAWILKQIRTAHHEYSHIIHQRHNLPSGFKELTPSNYKSNNWLNLAGDVQAGSPRISREAISLGMVTNYGTSDVHEDFCEIISIYLTSSPDEFASRYLTHEPEKSYPELDADGKPVLDKDGNPVMLAPAADAVEMNKGRDFIAVKLKMIKNYYMQNFSIDLEKVRDELLKRLDEINK